MLSKVMNRIEIDENKLRELHAQGLSCQAIAETLGSASRNTIHKRLSSLGLKTNNPSHPMPEEAKKKLSEKRKEWIRNNPDKHPWRSSNKFKSVPCEKVKDWLKANNIEFIPEMEIQCTDGHTYYMDIAFPDKKVGLEVNGNQHYNRDGTLKPYYQQREDLIKAQGWELLQIHYSLCFNLEKVQQIVNQVFSGQTKEFFDYKKYLEEREIIKAKIKQPKTCPVCGVEISRGAKTCKKCWKRPLFGEYNKPKKERKFSNCLDCECRISKSSCRCKACASKIRENKKTRKCTKEELVKLINEMPMVKVGRLFGVSDNAIRKWCYSYGIILPNRVGYWAKLKYGKTEPIIIT